MQVYSLSCDRIIIATSAVAAYVYWIWDTNCTRLPHKQTISIGRPRKQTERGRRVLKHAFCKNHKKPLHIINNEFQQEAEIAVYPNTLLK